jgi:GST-like protein
MIDLYYANSGNSLRALVALEEAALEYRGHVVDLAAKEHKASPFLAMNPFGLVPVAVISDGPSGKPVTLTQSGAILLYAAERTGRLVPSDPCERLAMLEWCLFAASDASPASAILRYMTNGVPSLSQSGRTFLEERLLRLMGGVERHLASSGDYLLSAVSMADLALFPVVLMRRSLLHAAGDTPRLLRWAERVGARPSIVRAVALCDVTAAYTRESPTIAGPT